MGQKVHPGGLRVGIIHDWKSNWYMSNKDFAGALLEDVKIREHIYGKLVARRPVRHPHPQGQAADHHRHLHRAAGHRDRQVGRRGRRAAPRDPWHDAEERPDQHQRDQAPRARRQARRAVDRGAAPEPRQLPARDEALAGVGDALRRPRRQGPVRRSPRRHRDVPLREVLGGPRPAAHAPRRHRLRLRRGEDDLRPDRRQGLDQQGRDHARGLRGCRRAAARYGSASRTRRAAPRRRRAGGPRPARGPPRPAIAKVSARCAGAGPAAAADASGRAERGRASRGDRAPPTEQTRGSRPWSSSARPRPRQCAEAPAEAAAHRRADAS